MMKLHVSARIVGPFLAAFALAACDVAGDRSGQVQHDFDAGPTPWTDRTPDDDDSKFTFAIFSDLYGGERDRVFDIAVQQLALLKPAFVLSVGDLIDGGSEDRQRLAAEWDAFEAKLEPLSAPVFFVGGNHDLTNLTMRDIWIERFGARYYHFLYRGVLFLVLDSEDADARRMQEVFQARAEAIEVLEREGQDAYTNSAYFSMPERRTGAMSEEQSRYFRDVLVRYPDVRWTFVLMHKPLWRDASNAAFRSLEEDLAGRPYTVINGHFHSYSLTQRNGRDYIHLGTTSGSQNAADPNSFDHVTLVAVGSAAPTIVNLRLEGILDKAGNVPLGGNDVCFSAARCAAD